MEETTRRGRERSSLLGHMCAGVCWPGEWEGAPGAVVAAEAARADVVLARPTTSPEDVAGMIAARGVIV